MASLPTAEHNGNVTAVLNLPLIADSLAVRAVIYNDQSRRLYRQRAGYLHAQGQRSGDLLRELRHRVQVGRHRPRAGGVHSGLRSCYRQRYQQGTAFAVPPGSPVANNNRLQDNFNPVIYQGIRASALYQINDDWNAMLTQTYQNINAQGVFYQMPKSADGAPLQPLQVTVVHADATTRIGSRTPRGR